MIKIKVRTLFDITATGVTGHFKSSRHDFDSQESWNRARNQQRNWETLVQLLNLRTQIMEITVPVNDKDFWSFEFESELLIYEEFNNEELQLKKYPPHFAFSADPSRFAAETP